MSIGKIKLLRINKDCNLKYESKTNDSILSLDSVYNETLNIVFNLLIRYFQKLERRICSTMIYSFYIQKQFNIFNIKVLLRLIFNTRSSCDEKCL